MNKDPVLSRMASYGANYLDRVIKNEKPDVYIGAQDIWGIEYATKKPWFSKINSAIWTTLDSLPILPSAIDTAKKVDNYWVWSSFAEKALHELGYGHVKTLHGAVDPQFFKPLKKEARLALRNRFEIEDDNYVIGFVFRNQLRKSVPNLLEGFKLFKRKNPEAKPKLLLHTHFGEGWSIPRLAKEYEIPSEDILTTYICRHCFQYQIKPFFGEEQDCPWCGTSKAQVTTQVSVGVSEPQLNEIYNMMDVYCHPFTSGGQEIPIQEAKLTELVTLVTDYSCGEEMCQRAAASLPLDWNEYREHGTEFKKASTDPESIEARLSESFLMGEKERKELGEKARKWTIENYSPENVGKKIEEFIDGCDYVEYDFSLDKEEKDPYYQMPEIEEDREWLQHMYENILKMKDQGSIDQGIDYWLSELGGDASREDVENYFRKVAGTEEETQSVGDFFENLVDEEDRGKAILYVMPESAGDVFLSTSLFESIRKTYPENVLYVATEEKYAEIISGNPHVKKVIDYDTRMDNIMWLEGQGNHKGFFEIAFLPHFGTQRTFDYQHNGKDKINFDLCI